MKKNVKDKWSQVVKNTRELLPKFKDDPLSELENFVKAIIDGKLGNDKDDIVGCLKEVLKDKEDRDAILGFVTQITNSVELRCKIMNEFMDEWSKE